MLNVFERVSEILLGIGLITLLAGLKWKKTAAFVTGIIVLLSGLTVMCMGMELIPNEFAAEIETKAVEMKYEDWDKQVTVIISKSSDSYTTHYRNRRRYHHNYFITYCTTGGLFTEKQFSEGLSYTEVLINGRLRAVKHGSYGSLDYETVPVSYDEYSRIPAGATVIVARRDDVAGEKVEFLVPEYTPESWKETYGIGEYYDSSDEFDADLHPRRCR